MRELIYTGVHTERDLGRSAWDVVFYDSAGEGVAVLGITDEEVQGSQWLGSVPEVLEHIALEAAGESGIRLTRASQVSSFGLTRG